MELTGTATVPEIESHLCDLVNMVEMVEVLAESLHTAMGATGPIPDSLTRDYEMLNFAIYMAGKLAKGALPLLDKHAAQQASAAGA